MAHSEFQLSDGKPKVVGSLGSAGDIRDASEPSIHDACDLAEIRLDLLIKAAGEVATPSWEHLKGVPLLFTARRIEEGGALALSASDRMKLLEPVLERADLIDIEVASIDEMAPTLEILKERRIQWVASYHDFDKLPNTSELDAAAGRALAAGASAFKSAARLGSPADVARLADFQLADHGLPVATMGMGPLAPVSRLLCAQCGSVLNYGYLGNTATAPGQWDAALLKQAVSRLAPFSA